MEDAAFILLVPFFSQTDQKEKKSTHIWLHRPKTNRKNMLIFFFMGALFTWLKFIKMNKVTFEMKNRKYSVTFHHKYIMEINYHSLFSSTRSPVNYRVCEINDKVKTKNWMDLISTREVQLDSTLAARQVNKYNNQNAA